MSRVARAALTETRNAFADMPARVEGLERLAGRMDEVREANLEHHLELIAAAAAEGARLVGLGELFTSPYFALSESPVWFELAEDAASGPTATRLCAAAARHGIVIVAPIYEHDAASGRRFNTALVIDADGTLLGKYRKAHVPHGANERAAFREDFYYERSDGELGASLRNVSRNRFLPVFATAAGRVGVSTCYDRHFPGVARILAAEGAEIVLSPAVTFGAKSRRLWELEFEVDAARQRLFIGGSNREGAEAPWNVEFFGASYFVGPNGRPRTFRPRPEVVVADLDLGELEGADPAGWDLARDARALE